MKPSAISIIYEDNHIIVVDKPVNIPVQADESGDVDMQNLVKDYLADKYQKTGNVYLGVVHRLDRPVGGVMLFAKTSKAASRLSDAFRRRDVYKVYHAVVLTGDNKIPEKGTLIHWLKKDTKTNMVRVTDSDIADSKKAILHFEKIGEDKFAKLALLRIVLETGRSHQIRVQCAAAGFPLWGDQRYNVHQSVPGQQIALFASLLEFHHPVKKGKVLFELDFPEREPWKLFK